MVKLQVLNLAVKLYLTNPQQSEPLCRYLFSLARYDENYDIRDRARFLKPFIFPSNGETVLSKQAKRIFLSAKPAPLLVSNYCREQLQLGSLAHYLNSRTNGYHDLPPFPKKAPDSSVRGVEPTANDNSNNYESNEHPEWENRSAKASNKSNKKDKSFYSDSENDSSDVSGSEESSDGESGSGSSNGESESGSKSGSGSDSGSEEGESCEETSSADSDSDDSSGSDDDSESDGAKNHKPIANAKAAVPPIKSERSNLDLLLDLGDIAPAAPIMTPSLGGFLTPITNAMQDLTSNSSSRFELVGPVHVSIEKRELLNKINGHGLQINYRFTRGPHLYSAKMVSIELTFHNESNNDLENIHVSNKSAVPGNVAISEFATIAKLSPGQCVQGILGIDFNDSTQPITFEISSSAGSAKVSPKSTVGEMIRAIRLTEPIFKEEQARLRGMNEHTCKLDTQSNTAQIQHSIFETANLALIANNSQSNGDDALLFAGQTMSSQSLVLVTVERNNESNRIALTVNCEKMVIGSMLLNEIKNSIKC